MVQASRHGGGSYRRAGRHYRANICLACASGLLERLTVGHWSVDRWDAGSLRGAVTRIERIK